MPKSTRPVCCGISPIVPPEIVDLIIQDETFDSSDFPNLSLVSYNWKEPSQRRLFSSINVDPGKEHPLFSILPNSNDTRLIRYIKHLTLFCTSTTSWIPFPCDSDEDVQVQFEGDPKVKAMPDDDFNDSEFSGIKLGATGIHLVPDPEASGPPHPKFSSFLQQLSRLETLVIRDRFNWYLLPRDVTQALFRIFSLDSFRSLDIWRGSATRLPFVFLHFCYNLERLSINVWPTTLLQPIGISDFDLLALEDKPNVRPTVLKLTGGDIVCSVHYYVDSADSNLGNSISFDRLRALYIAYEEDPSDAIEGIWASKRVGDFLLSFGNSLRELVLEIDHRSFGSRVSCAIPGTDLSNLTNLSNLRLIIHSGTLLALDFNEGFSWVIPFLRSLPSPSNLTTFQLVYTSKFKWTRDCDDRLRTGEEFLEELFEVLSSSFTGLRAMAIYMKLLGVNMPLDTTLSRCDIVDHDDYAGLLGLRARGVHSVLKIVMPTDIDKKD